jgi:hypothetical protein
MTTFRYRGSDDDAHTVEASACQPYESSPNIYVFVRPASFDDTPFPESVVSLGVYTIEAPEGDG